VSHTQEAIVELQNAQERCGSDLLLLVDHDLHLARYGPATENFFLAFLACRLGAIGADVGQRLCFGLGMVAAMHLARLGAR
jgi:hypothetical protein